MAHGGGNRPNAGRKPGSATKKNPARSRTKRACGPLVYLNSLAAGCSAGLSATGDFRSRSGRMLPLPPVTRKRLAPYNGLESS